MTNEDVVKRLDKLIAITQLAHLDEIERARSAIRADPVNAAILAKATKEVPAGKLTQTVRQKTKQSERTIARRIAELVDQGALEKVGAGPTTAYKATGLI